MLEIEVVIDGVSTIVEAAPHTEAKLSAVEAILDFGEAGPFVVFGSGLFAGLGSKPNTIGSRLDYD